MKKISVLFLFFILLFSKANAEDEVFEHENEVLGEVQMLQMPSCSDKAFSNKIATTAKAYLDTLPANSVLAKRTKILKLRNLHDFENVDVAGFSPQTDFATANALIMIKINERVEEEDILLCRQKSNSKHPVYVIAYPYLDNVKAYIINLDAQNPDYHAVQFIYP